MAIGGKAGTQNPVFQFFIISFHRTTSTPSAICSWGPSLTVTPTPTQPPAPHTHYTPVLSLFYTNLNHFVGYFATALNVSTNSSALGEQRKFEIARLSAINSWQLAGGGSFRQLRYQLHTDASCCKGGQPLSPAAPSPRPTPGPTLQPSLSPSG